MVTGMFSSIKCRERYQKKQKGLGLCISCSKKAIDGQVYCIFHREKSNEESKKYRIKAKWK